MTGWSDWICNFTLPGYGLSDKPLDVIYDFFNGLHDALGIVENNLVVHDLGGPVGVHWGLRPPERVHKLVLFNTLVYPETSWAAKLFLLAWDAVSSVLARSAVGNPVVYPTKDSLSFDLNFDLSFHLMTIERRDAIENRLRDFFRRSPGLVGFPRGLDTDSIV